MLFCLQSLKPLISHESRILHYKLKKKILKNNGVSPSPPKRKNLKYIIYTNIKYDLKHNKLKSKTCLDTVTQYDYHFWYNQTM